MDQRLAFLMDTSVVLETRKKRPNYKVAGFIENVGSYSQYISVMTLGELRKGVSKKYESDPVFASALALWVDRLERHYSDRVLPVDAATASMWGNLTVPRSRSVVNTLIAATALCHGLTVVTRNIDDFLQIGVPVVNPW